MIGEGLIKANGLGQKKIETGYQDRFFKYNYDIRNLITILFLICFIIGAIYLTYDFYIEAYIQFMKAISFH